MRNEQITAIACATGILAYWILDLNNLCKPLTQALIHPMSLLLGLCKCYPVLKLLDVDTAGALQTAARLISFTVTLSLSIIPALLYVRTKKTVALIAMWCGLAIVAFGLLQFVYFRVALSSLQ